MKTVNPRLLALALFLLAGAGRVAPAAADVDVAFGANVRIGDDTDLFLAISSRYFGYDPVVVRDWHSRYRDPDDCAVALFLASRARCDPEFVFRLRSGGLSWWAIGVQLGVPVDVWFVPVSYSPGPPYGKAYGHWRKYRHDHHHHFVLSDREACDLVALRMAHDYYGAPPRDVIRWRTSHGNVESLMSREYRRRHGDDRHQEMRGGSRDRERDRHDKHGAPGHKDKQERSRGKDKGR